MAGHLWSDRPTLAEIAARHDRTVEDIRRAVTLREVPVTESRIDALDEVRVLIGLRDVDTERAFPATAPPATLPATPQAPNWQVVRAALIRVAPFWIVFGAILIWLWIT